MAWIETRVGKKQTSYRVNWRVGKDKQVQVCDSPEQAAMWKRLIEQTNGDGAAVVRAMQQMDSNAPMLSAVAEEHIARLRNVEPYTKTKYRSHIKNHWSTLDAPVDAIDEDDIDRWITWMTTAGKGGKGYAPKTIANSHGFLYTVFEYAIKKKHREHNPCGDSDLPAVKRGDERDKFLTAEELHGLTPHFAEKYLPYVRFLFATGLRPGEFLALTPEDFTVYSGTAYVKVSKAVKQAADGVDSYIGDPKTEKAHRTIDVDDETMALIWPLIRAAGHGNPIFASGRKQSTHRLYQNMWEPAVRRAQDAGFAKRPNLYSLRHSHASHMLGLGVPIHELSWRMGHRSIQVTIDTYGHLVPSRMGVASKMFGEGTRIFANTAPARQLSQ